MTIHISMTTPGSELSKSPIDDAITFLASHIAIEKRKGNLPTAPTLDITFMLPSEHEKPGFRGMRMGGYTEENNTLYFETAVPEGITQSEKAPYYVAMVLEDVIDNADVFFKDNNLDFNISHWREALEKLTTPESSKIHH